MTDIITGNYFNKYASQNPLVRWVMRRYLETLYGYLDRGPVDSVVEAGCGEGEIITRVVERYHPASVTGFDIDEQMIAELRAAYPEHEFLCQALATYRTEQSYDVALCLEVLEHIEDVRQAARALRRIPASRYIISVPNEPAFRLANVLRLKYLGRLGNTPGHVHNFTGRDLSRILSDSFSDCRIETRTCWIWRFAYLEPS
jgi:2-polyprenyl-3-methyl-5-hydroxy-6-metoxy-1,4-benzoquinol methylase